MTTASRRTRVRTDFSAGVDKPVIRVARFPGRLPYREGLELQRRLARDRIDGRSQDELLLLVEHDPVLTLGRGTDPAHLTARAEELEDRGVERVEIERGGDVTYHGPGQLVGYPILHLGGWRKDLHWYLRALEAALIAALDDLGLPAFRVPGHTGVWVGDARAVATPAADSDGEDGAPTGETVIAAGRVRKVASIGVHVSRWVTWHGFALNVRERALRSFDLIVPCGIRDVRMTSLESEGVVVGDDAVRDAVAAGFASAFDARIERVAPEELVGGAGAGSAGGEAP